MVKAAKIKRISELTSWLNSYKDMAESHLAELYALRGLCDHTKPDGSTAIKL